MEVKQFLGMTLYLWTFFFLLGILERMALQYYEIHYIFYGVAITNAVVLAKIMLVAEGLHLGERFKRPSRRPSGRPAEALMQHLADPGWPFSPC